MSAHLFTHVDDSRGSKAFIGVCLCVCVFVNVCVSVCPHDIIIIIIKNEKIRVTLCENAAGAIYIVKIEPKWVKLQSPNLPPG